MRGTDFDGLGRLHHATYHACLGAARDDALRELVGGFEAWPSVLVHVSIDHLREIRLDADHVVVVTSIAAVGRTSVTLAQWIRTPSGDVAASAESVVVAWDHEARGSRQISPGDRAALGH